MNDAAHHADLNLAFRVVAGATPPTNPAPFDNFGQFGPGYLDKRCILQTGTWMDRDAVAHTLASMSAEYRSNVLAFLRHECPGWVYDAYALEVALAVTGVIAPQQASREIAALRSLRPGWVDHTPLGLRLHHLNGTRPHPLPHHPPPITADDSDNPEVLRDRDTGVWEVTTRSHSQYVLDLDRRQVRRVPGRPTNGDRPAARLLGDGGWTRLTNLVDCHVGSSLLVLDDRDNVDSYRHSTEILTIQRSPFAGAGS